jgi:outer membrane protein
MSRRSFLLAGALCLAAAASWGQQITRIGVVDLARITTTYSKDSEALREFELKKALIQTEVDRMAEEIRRLQAQKVGAEQAGDKQGASRYDSEIFRKTESLKEFLKTKRAELDELAKRLESAGGFVEAVYKQIQLIAETEGYSLVLNLKSGDTLMSSVLWYSPMIDITDKVIQALMGKAQ